MKRLLCLILLIMATSIAGFADIARPDKSPTRTPKPSKSIETNMTIRLKSDATEAVLRIPKSQVKQLRAALDVLDQADDTAENDAPAGSVISRTQTIVSGLFLSLALVFGGVWFVRSGKASVKSGKTLVILAVLAALGSAATFAFANAGPPPEARSITGKMFSQAVHYLKFGSGKIRLETKDDQNGVELIVPDPPVRPGGEKGSGEE
jgi:hypothetical protein